jgi:hypothetical protein
MRIGCIWLEIESTGALFKRAVKHRVPLMARNSLRKFQMLKVAALWSCEVTFIVSCIFLCYSQQRGF